MKIIQMIDSLKIGGAEQLQVTFAKAMQGQDVDLTIIALRDTASPVRQALEAMQVKTIIVPGRTLLDPLRLWELYKLVKEIKPDVIHAHLSTAIILGTLIGRWLAIPVVCTLHNTQLKSKNRARRALQRAALRQWATHIIGVGQRVVETFRDEVAPRSIEVLWNAVPEFPMISETEQTQLRHQLIGDAKGPLLIAVGRFVKAKGYLDLITAFQQIHTCYPETRLLLVGDGVLRDEITAQIEDSGLQDSVLLLGMRSDVSHLLAISDLFISSSHSEGLPVSVLEAMASGLPVVATDVGDMAQVVTPEVGFILPPRQPQELAQAACYLIEHPEQRAAMRRQAKARIDQHFSAATWSRRLLALYQSLAQGSGQGIPVKIHQEDQVNPGKQAA